MTKLLATPPGVGCRKQAVGHSGASAGWAMEAASNRQLTPAVGDPMQGSPEASGASDTAGPVRPGAGPAAGAPPADESSAGSQPAVPAAEITQVLDAVRRSE